jgi:hypothetical protein
MATTTEYGTWCNIVDRYSVNVETTVMDGYFGSEGAEGFDFEAIVDDYRDAINEALPDSVALSGNDFIGPYYEADQHFDGYPVDRDGVLDIKAIVDSIDLNAIAERHQTAA